MLINIKYVIVHSLCLMFVFTIPMSINLNLGIIYFFASAVLRIKRNKESVKPKLNLIYIDRNGH